MASVKTKKKSSTVYVVLTGSNDDPAEDVEVLGTFSTEKAAFKFRDNLYKEQVDWDDEDDSEIDFESTFVDDGVRFYMIQETTLD
jgi:hypothetical protein